MTIDELLTRGVDEVIIKESFEKKLNSGKKLRIKLGIDPTGPDLHLGHAVPLRKLKAFQDMGHTAIFIVGDFTARIGDPSEKDKTRKPLTVGEVKENAEGYFSQAFKIIDNEKTEVHMQSEWYEKMDLQKLFEITRQVSIHSLMKHETFKKRIENDAPLSLLEMMYPILQGYDSVEVKADVEIGATDQKFNILMGRQIQKMYGLPEQDILTLKYLTGLDGKEKMSKSLGNYIAINDVPEDMYGKVMSIPDSAIIEYFKLCTDVKLSAIDIIEKELSDSNRNPREIKAELAKLIVEQYHSAEEAETAESEFNRVFRDKEQPSEMKIKEIIEKECRLDDLLLKCDLVISKAEGQRLILQGGVQINSEKQTDSQKVIQIEDSMVIQVGKRNFIKIKK